MDLPRVYPSFHWLTKRYADAMERNFKHRRIELWEAGEVYPPKSKTF